MPRKYLSGIGPQPEMGGATLGTLACRYDAVDEAQTYRSEWLHRAASDRQAHNLREVRTPSAGSGDFSAMSSGQSHRHHWAGHTGVAVGAVRLKKRRGGVEANGNGVAKIEEPPNNGMQLTGRVGAATAFRWWPVVEARPAGEPGCYTDCRAAR